MQCKNNKTNFTSWILPKSRQIFRPLDLWHNFCSMLINPAREETVPKSSPSLRCLWYTAEIWKNKLITQELDSDTFLPCWVVPWYKANYYSSYAGGVANPSKNPIFMSTGTCNTSKAEPGTHCRFTWQIFEAGGKETIAFLIPPNWAIWVSSLYFLKSQQRKVIYSWTHPSHNCSRAFRPLNFHPQGIAFSLSLSPHW